MGLFDKLIKDGIQAVKDIASEENREKASSVFNSLKDKIKEQVGDLKETIGDMKASSSEERPRPAETVSGGEGIFDDYEDGLTCRQRILGILTSEFPQYTVRENVSPREIGGTGRFMDYSIAVYDGDRPKLFIMLIGKTTTSHREYRWSREEAEKRGYPFFNFVEHFPNRPEYITQRLHKVL